MTTLIPVSHLRPHEALDHLWSLPDEDERFHRIVESVEQSGIIEPLKITPDHRIADGRHRWRAARKIGMETVPCEIIDERRVAEIAMETRMARRHLMSRGQLAFEMYPLFARRHMELRDLQAAHLSRSPEAPRTERVPVGSVEDLAQQIGVGRELFKQAARLHQLFAARPELRTEWEPKIMREEEPIGLGAALAGIAGKEATLGVTPVQVHRNSSLHRWGTSWGVLAKETKAWKRWTAEERSLASTVVLDTIQVLPDEVLDVMTEALRTTRRKRKAEREDGAEDYAPPTPAVPPAPAPAVKPSPEPVEAPAHNVNEPELAPA